MKKIIFLIIVSVSICWLNNKEDYIVIPNQSFRIRIIASSNSPQDQINKLIIKNNINALTSDLVSNATSNEEMKNIINDNLLSIDSMVKNTIDNYGMNYNYNIDYGKNYFPEKIFKGVKYPGGTYDSIAITLGEGKGNNWWCVLFPPLCNVNENTTDYEYHFIIKDILDKYNS